jgi:hypothetical protein
MGFDYTLSVPRSSARRTSYGPNDVPAPVMLGVAEDTAAAAAAADTDEEAPKPSLPLLRDAYLASPYLDETIESEIRDGKLSEAANKIVEKIKATQSPYTEYVVEVKNTAQDALQGSYLSFLSGVIEAIDGDFGTALGILKNTALYSQEWATATGLDTDISHREYDRLVALSNEAASFAANFKGSQTYPNAEKNLMRLRKEGLKYAASIRNKSGFGTLSVALVGVAALGAAYYFFTKR